MGFFVTFIQVSGMRASYMASSDSFKAGLITMVPSMASFRSQRHVWTRLMTRCMRSISCLPTIETRVSPTRGIHISTWNLPEEDVHGQQNAHACQILSHLVRIILHGQLAQHVLSQLIDDALTGLAATAASLLGLHAEYSIQDAYKGRE